MFSTVISAALSSLSPFWSTAIIKSMSLGNEYNTATNMILTETIRYITDHLTDDISIALIILVVLMSILSYFKISIVKFSRLFKQAKTITTNGTEKYDNGVVTLSCSKAFRALNQMLIRKYNFKNLKYLKDTNFDIVVSNVADYELEKDLYVTVKNDQNNKDMIYIILTSYNKDIHQIIKDAIVLYDDEDKKYKLTLIGKEDNGTSFDYPEAMKYLTYTLVNIYKMEKLKILNDASSPKENALVSPNSNNKKNAKNATQTEKETKTDSIRALEEDFNNKFLLEDCKNFPLNDDVHITIERTVNIVTYTLFSRTTNLQEFLRKCIDFYKTEIAPTKYKYVLKISGYEMITANESSIKYPNSLISLCHKLIQTDAINNFRVVEIDKQSVRLIDTLSNFTTNGIVINTIRSVQSQNYWDCFIHVTYVLESHTVNLHDYICKCEKEYNKYLDEKNDNILYYFKYLGKVNNELKFSKTILSSPDDPLYETFDTLHNEHVDKLKKDITTLKNLEYYKKTGLRRKKSYLFYGEPGCGKNAAVTAMALYDNRHIIDIPFGILQYNSEFNELMNLGKINGIEFKKDQVIIMFDEMHTGLEKICKNFLQIQNDIKDSDTLTKSIVDTLKNEKSENIHKNTSFSTFNQEYQPYGIPKNTSFDTLDLGCVQSLLDGIGNYGGIIFIGLTNYIDRIPPPLKRSLRLTPFYFTYLRIDDAVKIINSSFDIELSPHQKRMVPDRKITPAKLRLLCEQTMLPIDEFIQLVIKDIEE